MSKYAIMGITGQVGGATAEKLLSDGANIRAVVRDEAKAELWRARGMEAAVVAYDDVDALKSAFSHVDGVFIMTPTWFSTPDMFEENERAIHAIGSALRALPPTKIVLLSSIGAHRESGTGAIMKLHAMEKAFADLPFVMSIRAAWFMENIAGLIAVARTTGILPSMLAPLDRAVPMIATTDIGQQVAASLQSKWSGHNIIELEGPDQYTPGDLAAALSVALSRTVVAQVLPPREWQAAYQSWGLTPRSGEAMAEMVEGFNSGWIGFEKGAGETLKAKTTLTSLISSIVSQPS